MTKPITGTKEWSTTSVNCVLGCTHRCRYCYARADALRRKQITDPEEWGTTYNRVREKEVRKRRKLHDGTVMFPTTHDITPEFLDPCMDVIGKLLAAGNRLLIVSKPHLECIGAICERFGQYREQILFRFSIGAVTDSILRYWEPGATLYRERWACLLSACRCGFGTSVSCEPLLDATRAVELFRELKPYVTDTVWLGKLNHIDTRVIPGTDPGEIARIKAGQTDASIRRIYGQLKDEPKVRWKESFKKVLGLKLAEDAGADQ